MSMKPATTEPAFGTTDEIDARLACEQPLRLEKPSVVLSTSFAFGGANAAVLFGGWSLL